MYEYIISTRCVYVLIISEQIIMHNVDILLHSKLSEIIVDHPQRLKVARCTMLVLSVALTVCLSTCLYVCQTITVESPDVGIHICTCGIGLCPRTMGQVHIWRSSGQGQGHRSQKGRKILFLQCKTLIGNYSRSIKHRAVKFECFQVWWIECCDCNLCHVTGSEHA